MLVLFYCAPLGLMIAAALIAGRQPFRRVCAGLLAACSLALTWFAPGESCLRCLLAGAVVVALMAVIKIAFSASEQWSVRYRLLHLVSLAYPLRAGRIKPMLSLPLFGHFILEWLTGSVAFLVLWETSPAYHPGALNAVFRLAAGVVIFYTGVAFLRDLAHFCFLAAGVSMNPIHPSPIAARSVREFWGQRWDRIAGAWLKRFAYLPLARRGRPVFGVFCAFFVSGALHAWPALVALGMSAAFSMAAFFGLQAVFILAEDRLQVHVWPSPLARAWTLLILLASSPLFIDPFLRCFHL